MTDLSLKQLFADPEFAMPQISPDGSRVAYLRPIDGALNVWVRGSSGDEPLTRRPRAGVRNYAWCHDSKSILHLVDDDGNENWVLRRTAIGAGGHSQALTPTEGVAAEFVAHVPSHPHEVLVALNADQPDRHDLHHIDLRTGSRLVVARSPGYVGWLVDAELRPRGGVLPTDDGGWLIEVSTSPGGTAEPRARIAAEDASTTVPLGFDHTGGTLFLLSSHGGSTTAVCALDVATGVIRRLTSEAGADVVDAHLSADGLPRLAKVNSAPPYPVDVVGTGRADVLRRLGEDACGVAWVVSSDLSDRHWIVEMLRDHGPTGFYRYDSATGEQQHLDDDRPWLWEAGLATRESFSVTARDGLRLAGYLTFPRGSRGPLSTVLLVHGGPWEYDAWGLDRDAQWLASLGYMCVQVNFRGSTGYGKEFVNAGDRQWGAAMQHDLLDALDRLAQVGHVNPHRVAIMGASYGGYAALVGASSRPQRFACAIDAFGPSDLRTLLASIPAHWKPLLNFYHRRVGHPEHDAEQLWHRSPLSRAHQITKPLLVLQGARDPRVPTAESDQIVAAVRANGGQVRYVVFEDEGHGLEQEHNRMRYYSEIQEFLAIHLPTGGRP